MNDILKQRLVGALILVALGVVFWPIIFVEPGSQPAEEQRRMPPRPQVDSTPIEPPDQVGLRPTIAVAARQDTAEVEVAELEPEPEPAPETLASALPQVGTADPAPSAPVPAAAKPVQPADVPTRSTAPEKLALDKQGVPIAWILQVASVSAADKAEQLRQQLLAKDRKAYTRKIRSNGKELYRVYVGPKFERAQLERLKTDIDREFGVSSMIVRYVP
ncbi:MAG: SPOR domain-containing protein [Gammaproteobacteria bacterium]|nr:SPOR domain-containing protein [Gammaproteobacteria bacterium]